MKLRSLIAVAALLLPLFFSRSPAFSMDDPGFAIKRMVVCENVVDREPVGIDQTFPATAGEVYTFLEAVDIEQDTTVSFVWYYDDREMARVSLELRKGGRWRTFASKKIGGLAGAWQVELQEASGIVLHSVSFQVR